MLDGFLSPVIYSAKSFRCMWKVWSIKLALFDGRNIMTHMLCIIFFCGHFAVIARVEICILPRLLGTCLFQHYSWTTLTFWNSHWSPLCTTELRRRPRWCFATLLMWMFFMLSLNRPITSMRLHKASNDQDYSVKKHNSKSYHNSKIGLL